jgi:hypothetical protein
MVDSIIGSIASWSIALSSIVLVSGYAILSKQKIRSKALPKLNLVASAVLIYMAIDIDKPFPYLSTSLASVLDIKSGNGFVDGLFQGTRLSSIMLVLISFVGIALAIVTSKDDEEIRGLEQTQLPNVFKSFATMTLLPIVVQFWVLVAATNSLESFGGILTTGLFILSGPSSWQFASLAIISSDRKKTEFFKLVGIMGLSLVSTIIAAFVGLYLRSANTEINGSALQHLASFTLLIVPFLLFYSHKGDTWREERVIGTILGMVILGIFSSFQMSVAYESLTLGLIIWFLLLFLPDILYPTESWIWTIKCPKCQKTVTFGLLYKDSKKCLNCGSDYETTQEKIEERKSLRGYFHMLYLGIKIKPSQQDLRFIITPKRNPYKVGDKIKIDVTVFNKSRKSYDWPVLCRVEISCRTKGRWRRISESEDIPIAFGRSELFETITTVPNPGTFFRTRRKLKLRAQALFTEAKVPGYYTRVIPFPQPARKTLELLVI